MICSRLPATSGPPRGPISCPPAGPTCSMRARWGPTKASTCSSTRTPGSAQAGWTCRWSSLVCPVPISGSATGPGSSSSTNVPHAGGGRRMAARRRRRRAQRGAGGIRASSRWNVWRRGPRAWSRRSVVCWTWSPTVWRACTCRRATPRHWPRALRRLARGRAAAVAARRGGPAKAARFTLSQVMPRLDEVYLRVLDDAALLRRSGSENSGREVDFNGDARSKRGGLRHDRFHR